MRMRMMRKKSLRRRTHQEESNIEFGRVGLIPTRPSLKEKS